MTPIVTWRNLHVWEKAHELTLQTYKITSQFPGDQKYSLVNQMQRAAVSVASNIVEGFRKSSLKDSLKFYNTADASLEELRYQCLLSKDLTYITTQQHQEIEETATSVSRLLHAWIASQRQNISQ